VNIGGDECNFFTLFILAIVFDENKHFYIDSHARMKYLFMGLKKLTNTLVNGSMTAALTIAGLSLACFYVFLSLYFGRGLRLLSPGNRTETPSVTVVCSARNEEANISCLLERLALQTYPAEKTEFILVDDRSSDRTPRLIADFVCRHSNASMLRIGADEASPSPKKYALARAIERASGELILTTDADCLPGPEWIAELVRCYDPETGMVLGYAPYRTDGIYGSLFHKLLALEYFTMGAVAAATSAAGHPSTCNGANFSFRRAVFEEVGGYGDGRKWLSGDDDLLMQRVRAKTGWKIRFAASKNASVPNNPPRNIREFILQRIRFSSKHLAYPPRMIAVLSGVYLLYACLLIMTAASFFVKGLALFCCLAWTAKIVAELSFLIPFRRRMEDRKLLKYYMLLTPFHLLYVVFIPVLGQIVRPRWK
jgi:cellulose synthase/poly-beta-1,6-N-acetylglucosamine synthase-like glycosyltransferase